MLGGIWNFLKRHRRKFIFAGAVIGGTILIGKYAKKKLEEIQDREAAECLAYARKQHHFDSNQRTCNMTVLSMLPTLREALVQALDSERLTEQLKSKPANKLEIWTELKIMSFCRTVCSVYSLCMVVAVLRVQLNIIGGYMYQDSLQARQSQASSGQTRVVATQAVQQAYLDKVHYLLGQGLTDLIAAIHKAVQQTVGSLSLKSPISLFDIQIVLNKIRKQIEFRQTNGYHDASASSLCHFMMQTEAGMEEARSLTADELTVHKLTRETQDMLESADFHTVLTTLLDTAFTRLLDKIAEYFKHSPQEGSDIISNPNDVSMPLAKLIPIMNGLVHSILADAPNQFAQELLLKEQVKDFAANVYEAFSQPDNEQTPA